MRLNTAALNYMRHRGVLDKEYLDLGERYRVFRTIPGPNGQTVPVVYDTYTGETTIGFPEAYIDPFTGAMDDLVPIYFEAVSVFMGGYVTLETGSYRVGYEAYDIMSNFFKTLLGEPAGLPEIPIDVINPPDSE